MTSYRSSGETHPADQELLRSLNNSLLLSLNSRTHSEFRTITLRSWKSYIYTTRGRLDLRLSQPTPDLLRTAPNKVPVPAAGTVAPYSRPRQSRPYSMAPSMASSSAQVSKTSSTDRSGPEAKECYILAKLSCWQALAKS